LKAGDGKKLTYRRRRNDNTILSNDLMEGLKREFGKEGKIVGKR
jgi:hypothetical protein